MCVLSILWLPMVKSSQGGQIFVYINAVLAGMGSPVGAVFLWAILWKHTTETIWIVPPVYAAFYGMLVSQAVGLVRVVLEFVYPQPGCGQVDTRPAVLYNVHYTYFGPLNMLIASIVVVLVSFLFRDEPLTNLEGTTWWTRHRGLTPTETEDLYTRDSNVDLDRIELQNYTNGVATTEEEIPRDRRFLHFICAMPKGNETANRVAMSVTQIKRFLAEKPAINTLLNVAAGIHIFAIVFLLGYYH